MYIHLSIGTNKFHINLLSAEMICIIFTLYYQCNDEPVREFNIGDSTSPNSDEKPGFSFVEGEVGSPFPISRTGSEAMENSPNRTMRISSSN